MSWFYRCMCPNEKKGITKSKINILVVGASGRLGSAVTRQCLSQPNLAVSILVRDPQKNKELASQVAEAGGRVFKGDLSQPESLKGVTKGMHTVIMTFNSHDEKVTVDGQIAMINDCVENKVQRVVPAAFGTNIHNEKYTPKEVESISLLTQKIRVKEYLKTLPIKYLEFNTGILIDFYFEHMMHDGFVYWGDANTKLQFTSYEDTGRVVAAAVAQKDRTGEVVYVSNEATTVELAEAYNRVRGTNLKARQLGTLEEMLAKVKELKAEGKHKEAFWLQFNIFVYDERARFGKTNNSEFRDVEKTSLEEFFKQHPNIRV